MSDYFAQMWQLASRGDVQGIWFWCALYTFLVCAYSVFFQLRTRQWPSVQGALIHSGIEAFGGFERKYSNTEYTARAQYHYTVAGAEYEGTRVSPWIIVATFKSLLQKQLDGIQRDAQGRVTVFYNPNKPAKSYLIMPSMRGLIFTATIGLLPALSYWLKFH